MTPQAYLYICDGDIDHPVLTHKKTDWSEKYPHWQEIPLVMAQPEPVIDKSAAVRIATSLGWEPKRKPLTDEEIMNLCASEWASHPIEVARIIEAAHGIKE